MERIHRVHYGSILIILIGLIFVSPLYSLVGGAPVFYMQIIMIIMLIPFIHIESGFFSLIDQCVVAYLVWVMTSFFLNIPVLWIENRSDLFGNQALSLFNLFLLVLPYLFGRYYFRTHRDVRLFVYSAIFAFSVILFYFSIFYSTRIHDLYLARHTMEQRLPMMITFIAWSICALGFWEYSNRVLLIVLWIISTIIILLSLTRAAYIQWIISGIMFVAITFYRGGFKISFLIRMLAVFFVIIGFFVTAAIFMKSKGVVEPTVIVERIEQLITPRTTLDTDESASVRTEIWRQLSEKIKESPVHFAIGYGQLGPSYIGETFTSLSGLPISSYSAHSQYLDTLVRAGIVGLVVEILFYGIVIIIPFIKRPLDPQSQDFFLAHSIGLLGVAFYAFFHETLRWQMFGFYFWLYAGMLSSQFSRQKQTT